MGFEIFSQFTEKYSQCPVSIDVNGNTELNSEECHHYWDVTNHTQYYSTNTKIVTMDELGYGPKCSAWYSVCVWIVIRTR